MPGITVEVGIVDHKRAQSFYSKSEALHPTIRCHTRINKKQQRSSLRGAHEF